MIYSAKIKTLKNRFIIAPLKTPLVVTAGLVYKVSLDFPSGSAGLMGVAIFDGSFQVWPSTLGQWFVGDGLQISFDDIYLKQTAPYSFDIYTYNEDTEYPHTVSVRIGLVSKDIFMARFLPHLSYKYFQEMLENLQNQQQKMAGEQKQQVIENPFPWLPQTLEE